MVDLLSEPFQTVIGVGIMVKMLEFRQMVSLGLFMAFILPVVFLMIVELKVYPSVMAVVEPVLLQFYLHPGWTS